MSATNGSTLEADGSCIEDALKYFVSFAGRGKNMENEIREN